MKFWDNYAKLLITEGIILVFIILSVLILKLGFKESFNDFKNWYSENILTDTDVYEVVE